MVQLIGSTPDGSGRARQDHYEYIIDLHWGNPIVIAYVPFQYAYIYTIEPDPDPLSGSTQDGPYDERVGRFAIDQNIPDSRYNGLLNTTGDIIGGQRDLLNIADTTGLEDNQTYKITGPLIQQDSTVTFAGGGGNRGTLDPPSNTSATQTPVTIEINAQFFRPEPPLIDYVRYYRDFYVELESNLVPIIPPGGSIPVNTAPAGLGYPPDDFYSGFALPISTTPTPFVSGLPDNPQHPSNTDVFDFWNSLGAEQYRFWPSHNAGGTPPADRIFLYPGPNGGPNLGNIAGYLGNTYGFAPSNGLPPIQDYVPLNGIFQIIFNYAVDTLPYIVNMGQVTTAQITQRAIDPRSNVGRDVSGSSPLFGGAPPQYPGQTPGHGISLSGYTSAPAKLALEHVTLTLPRFNGGTIFVPAGVAKLTALDEDGNVVEPDWFNVVPLDTPSPLEDTPLVQFNADGLIIHSGP